MRLTLLIICLSVFILSCTTTPSPTPFRQDPLIGKIIHAHTGQAVQFAELMTGIQKHHVIYLSEKHDNPMHHAVQQRIIRHLVDKGQKPVLGFEFFAMQDTPLLMNFIESKENGHPDKYEKALEAAQKTGVGKSDRYHVGLLLGSFEPCQKQWPHRRGAGPDIGPETADHPQGHGGHHQN